jgi:hypothetical protein
MSTPEDYLQNHNASQIKVGDFVRVLFRSHINENGWDNGWTPDMNNAIGFTYKVIEDNGIYGFRLNSPDRCCYPYFALSIVR